MKLYLVERTDSIGYDEYDSFVCIAESAQQARETWPSQTGNYKWNGKGWVWTNRFGDEHEDNDTWRSPDTLKVTEIGLTTANEPRVICASFNAG